MISAKVMKALTAILIFAQVSCRRVWLYLQDWDVSTDCVVKDTYMSLIAAGVSDLINGFLVPNCTACGAADVADSAADWTRLLETDRQAVLDALHQKHGHLLVSTGSSSYGVDYLLWDPTDFAQVVCGHAQQFKYDGVDFAFEGFTSELSQATVHFLLVAVPRCREYVDLVTAAPLNIYFQPDFGFAALFEVVDYFLVQFFNQGDYQETYTGTFIDDGLGTAWKDIVESNLQHKDQVVVGKYVYAVFGSSGIMTARDLARHLKQAEEEYDYSGAIMIWKQPRAEDGLRYQWLYQDLPLLVTSSDSQSDGHPVRSAARSHIGAALTQGALLSVLSFLCAM